MVGFGERIVFEGKSLPPAWRAKLLNYEELKERLDAAIEALAPQLGSSEGTSRFVREATRNSFQHLLDSELEKVLAHYRKHAVVLTRNVRRLDAKTKKVSETLAGHGGASSAALRQVGRRCARLFT